MESSALPSPPPSRTSKSTQTAPPPSTAASSRPDPPADAVQSGSIGGVREASRPPPRIAPRPAALARTSRSTQTAPPPLAVGSSRLARVGVTGVVTGAYVLLPRIAPATPPSMRTSKSTQVAPPPSTAELTRPSPSVNPSAPARHAQQDMVVSSGQNADVERTAAKETTSNQDMDVEGTSSRKRPHEGINLEEDDPDMPKIGMEFDLFNDAEDFYHRYSAKVGFSVRIRRTKFDHGVVIRRTYCCYKEGFRDLERRKAVAYHRPDIRCGCNAHYSVKLLPDGKYQIFQFDPNHNHDVVAPEKVHLLRSHRRMLAGHKGEVDVESGSVVASKNEMEFMGRQAGGRKNFGFIGRDSRKYLQTKRKVALKKGEASSILEYFQRMQSSNPSSSYALQLDENELLTNIFWADPSMIVDYHHFGDVVCFDTTYKTHNEECPLALFLGVNHHKQLVVFGAALLFDDTSATFEWLFSTFIQTMGGRNPKTILTEECEAMNSAVSLVLPGTCHRLCAWHMHKNAMGHLHDVFKRNPNLLGEFENCVFDYIDSEQFELSWCDMITKYDLQENRWLKEMFEIRGQWCLAYGRDNFCADMVTTQRNETLNSAVKKGLPRGCSIMQFFEHFEKVLDSRRYEELKADCNMGQTTQYMCVQWKLLRHAESVYTPAVFKIFEKEVIVIFDLELSIICVDGTITKYRVSETNPSRVCTVTYDDADCTISCTCQSFEFVGILCRHALKVFERLNVMSIPEQYILKRWTKKAKQGVIGDYHDLTTNLDLKEQISARYRDLCPILIQLATKAALCDEASIMVANFALKMIEDIDSHMGCALASRSQIDTTTVGNRLKSVEKENQRMVDSSTMHDQSQLGGEEVDDDQTVHVGVEKEKASRSHCRLKSAPEKVVKGKKSSPKASKAKKPRNTLLVGEQTSVMAPPVGIESSAQLQPQVTIPSSSVSWPYIANYPIF